MKAGSIPSPVSRTIRRTLPPSLSNRTSTRPPPGVNLTALLRRFHATCWRRTASPATTPTPGSRASSRRTFLASAPGRAAAELLREREVRPAVRAPGLRGRQREGTEDLAPGDERDHDPRAVGERTEIAETVAVAGHLHEHLVGHLGDQDRLAGPEDVGA